MGLDEERHEQVAEEEQELQGELHGRLQELRKRRATTAARLQSLQQQQQQGAEPTTFAASGDRDATAASEGAVAIAETPLPIAHVAKVAVEPLADDGSGSDVEFDWRSKEFG